MKRGLNNFAFIDSQNLNLGIRKLGWKLNYNRFRVYLRDKYKVSKAYIFIGFTQSNQQLYNSLKEAGFILKFKPTIPDDAGKLKGNVDADLVLHAMIDLKKYEKAVIVSSDGDFYSLVDYLYKEDKLEAVICSEKKTCSYLLKRSAKEKLRFMDDLRSKLEYVKSTP